MVIKDQLLDQIAELEVKALLEGLQDPELRRNPSFLEKVRKFLAQVQTTPETPGVAQIQKATEEIPNFNEVTIN